VRSPLGKVYCFRKDVKVSGKVYCFNLFKESFIVSGKVYCRRKGVKFQERFIVNSLLMLMQNVKVNLETIQVLSETVEFTRKTTTTKNLPKLLGHTHK